MMTVTASSATLSPRPRTCSRQPSARLPRPHHHRAAPSRILRAAAGPDNDGVGPPPPLDADEALLMEDLRRYGGGGSVPGPSGRGRDTPPPTQPVPASSSSSSSSAKDLLDKALITNFFFILAALAWLVAGVGVSAGGGSTALLDAWYGLWPMVFQPAIGALMAGALISGALGWLRSKDE